VSTESVQIPGLLPEGAVLVHIGPYKTGTTAIQTSLHAHRAALEGRGITYPGRSHRQMRQSWALLGRSRVGEDDVPEREWDAMVEEVRGASGRVVISSEDFSSARAPHIHKLVDDLGPDRVHVLIVARRLDKLLPSAWQERVKSVNETRTYDAWLREVLSVEREGGAARTFWHNHGLDTLIGRWSAELSPDRIVVLVNDEADRRLQAATFERLLGLADGTLTPGPHSNTSLSMERIELCRQVNIAAREGGWVGNKRLNPARRALLAGLRSAPLTEWETLIPPLPSWTVDRLTQLSDVRADAVATAPVTVIGDPELLRWHGEGAGDDLGEPPSLLPVEAASEAIAHALAGVIAGRGRARRRTARRQAPPPSDPMAGLSSRTLLRELARRPASRLRRNRSGG